MLRFENVTFGYTRAASPVIERFTWRPASGATVLLGPNGAGKSTLLALAADALRPWSGSVSVERDGVVLHRRARRAAVGWMPQRSLPIAGLTCREQVAYSGWLKGMSRSAAWEAAARALAKVDLADRCEERARRLSGGQLRRLGLAQVLVHEPQIVLLDEPTVGLDPAQRAGFRTLLAELSQQPGLTVIASTHQVDDLSELFERVMVLHQGMIRFEGRVSDFLSRGEASDLSRRAEQAYTAIVGTEY